MDVRYGGLAMLGPLQRDAVAAASLQPFALANTPAAWYWLRHVLDGRCQDWTSSSCRGDSSASTWGQSGQGSPKGGRWASYPRCTISLNKNFVWGPCL